MTGALCSCNLTLASYASCALPRPREEPSQRAAGHTAHSKTRPNSGDADNVDHEKEEEVTEAEAGSYVDDDDDPGYVFLGEDEPGDEYNDGDEEHDAASAPAP